MADIKEIYSHDPLNGAVDEWRKTCQKTDAQLVDDAKQQCYRESFKDYQRERRNQLEKEKKQTMEEEEQAIYNEMTNCAALVDASRMLIKYFQDASGYRPGIGLERRLGKSISILAAYASLIIVYPDIDNTTMFLLTADGGNKKVLIDLDSICKEVPGLRVQVETARAWIKRSKTRGKDEEGEGEGEEKDDGEKEAKIE